MWNLGRVSKSLRMSLCSDGRESARIVESFHMRASEPSHKTGPSMVNRPVSRSVSGHKFESRSRSTWVHRPVGGCTRIGDDNYLMNGAHIGHDCQIGNNTIIASFCGLAGHAKVDDFAVLGAYTGLHQHARVGESVMAAGGSKLSLDAPPFAMVAGDRARLVGLNSVGLHRRGFSAATCSQIKHAFHLIFRSKLRLEDALTRVDQEAGGVPEVERLVSFLRKTERGFCR